MKGKKSLLYLGFFLVCLLNGCTWTWFDEDGEDSGNDYSVTVSPSSVTLARGASQQFSAEVSNKGYSPDFTWSIEGSHAAGTTISQGAIRGGILTIAGNETAKSFKVKASADIYTEELKPVTVSGTAAVTIAGGDTYSVTVSPSSLTLARGASQQFSAQASGSSSPSFTWSIEGSHAAGTTVSQTGLLTVAGNESARSFKVKASTSDSVSGTAAVTIIAVEIPRDIKVISPESAAIGLSWSAVNNAASYKVYRSTNGTTYSLLTTSISPSCADTTVTAGSSYYYGVSAVVNGQESERSAPAFGFAAAHLSLPDLPYQENLQAGAGRCFRLGVTAGKSYTITWRNLSGGNAGIRCTVWQNNGTQIFASNDAASSKKITASGTGFITVEVRNSSSNSLDYQIDYD
jgi:hypothetical protein